MGSGRKLRRVVFISGALVACSLATLYWIGVSAPPSQPALSRQAGPQRGVLARPAQTSPWIEADTSPPVAAPQKVQDPPSNRSHPIPRTTPSAGVASPPSTSRGSVSAHFYPAATRPSGASAGHTTAGQPPAQIGVPDPPKSLADPHPTAQAKPGRSPEHVAQSSMADFPEPADAISPEQRHPNQWSTPRYHVQVGVFDDRKGARALVTRLEGLGFAARVVEGRPARVWVGGFLDRRTAEDLRVHLQTAGFDAALTP